jgi:hypothetical protein
MPRAPPRLPSHWGNRGPGAGRRLPSRGATGQPGRLAQPPGLGGDQASPAGDECEPAQQLAVRVRTGEDVQRVTAHALEVLHRRPEPSDAGESSRTVIRCG